MKKWKEILIILQAVFMSVTPLIYKTVERRAIEMTERKAQEKIEHAGNMYKSLVTDYEQQIQFRYDEHGNYIKETKTQKIEVEILELKHNEVKVEKDSLQKIINRSNDLIPEMKTLKVNKL